MSIFMSRSYHRSLFATVLTCAVLSGCGGSNNDTKTTSDITLNLSGAVSAKGGTLAMGQPQGWQHLWAWLAGKQLSAATEGVTPAAGVTVSLYKVDSSGNTVGDALASATTDGNGAYTISASGAASDLQTGSGLIVKAAATETLSAFVTDTAVDIDPVTDATVQIVTELVGDLNKLSVGELSTLQDEVASLAANVDPNDSVNNTALAEAIKAQVKYNEEASSMIQNAAGSQQVCGTVKDSSSTAIANVVVVARDFNELQLRAKTKTDSSGAYCLDLLPGDYVIGARNRTSASFAAGEWYTAAGGTPERFGSDKVTLADGDPVKTIDFVLGAGGRIEGTITAGTDVTVNTKTWTTGDPLRQIQVEIRRYDNQVPVESVKTNSLGQFRANVAPGEYFIVATNRTRQPFASEIYDAASGSNIQEMAARLTVAADGTTTINMALEEGKAIAGSVKKNDGSGAAGQRVRIDDSATGGSAGRLRANLEGNFRVWLKPGQYNVYSRGQKSSVDVSASSKLVTFDAAMAEVTLKLVDAADTSKNISQAKVLLRDASAWSFVSQELTSGDGTTILYSPYDTNSVTSYNYMLEIKFDGGQYLASQIYNGKTSMGTGDVIVVSSDQPTHNIGAVSIAAGGVLSGTVYLNDGTTPVGNKDVRIYTGGQTGTNRFVSTRTMGDGSFTVSLPVGDNSMYTKFRVGNTWGSCTTCLDIDLTTTVAYPAFAITAGSDFTFGRITDNKIVLP